MYIYPCPRAGHFPSPPLGRHPPLSSDDVFQETSARYRAVEPEQWLQHHPEAGSSWPSWPQASSPPKKCVFSVAGVCRGNVLVQIDWVRVEG